MIKHYIEWLHGGRMLAETNVQEAPTRELPAEIPASAAGYRFFSRSELVLEGDHLIGQAKDHSPWHYFGKEYNLDQLALEHGTNSILYGNVAGNGYRRAVHTCTGNWYPLSDDETVGAKP